MSGSALPSGPPSLSAVITARAPAALAGAADAVPAPPQAAAEAPAQGHDALLQLLSTNNMLLQALTGDTHESAVQRPVLLPLAVDLVPQPNADVVSTLAGQESASDAYAQFASADLSWERESPAPAAEAPVPPAAAPQPAPQRPKRAASARSSSSKRARSASVSSPEEEFEDDEDEESRQRREKNRLHARRSRQRKKQQISGLQTSLEAYRAETARLRAIIEEELSAERAQALLASVRKSEESD